MSAGRLSLGGSIYQGSSDSSYYLAAVYGIKSNNPFEYVLWK